VQAYSECTAWLRHTNAARLHHHLKTCLKVN
jgi:hypothetical protein